MVPKRIIATASLIIPSPKSTAFKIGYLVGYFINVFTLIRDMAATVSVAQRTLLIIIICFKLIPSKSPTIRFSMKVRHRNPIMVPITPKKDVTAKF